MFRSTEIVDNPEGGVMSPENRVGHCMIAVNELVIIYGGGTYPHNVYEELWIYNCIRQKWRLFRLPDQLRFTCTKSSICAHRSTIYIFGVPDKSESQNIPATLFSFDVRTFMWKDLFHELNKSGNRPPQMITSNIMFENESIYILGTNLDGVGVMYKFCLQTFQMNVIAHVGSLPHPEYEGHCKLYKNKIYYFGHFSFENDQFSQVRVFDLSTRIWEWRQQETSIEIYPENRLFYTLIFNDNYGYLAGGILPSRVFRGSGDYGIVSYNPNQPEGDEIWKIDLDTLKWTKLQTLETQHYFLQSCLVDNSYLYCFGGVESSGHIGLKRIIVSPPSLKFRCREVLGADENRFNMLAASLPPFILNDLSPDNI